jgi:uncharacterized protein (DUF1015 family)
MAKIIPFRAVRPTRDKVHLVVSKSVVGYKKRILNAMLDSNPFTFLQIIKPEHGKKSTTRPNTVARFQKTKDKYKEFVENEFLVQDEKKSLYIYQQVKGDKTFTGIIAGTSVADYYNNTIKKHELTITKREHMFKEYLKICDFNAEPVLLTYPDNKNIDNVIEKYLVDRPEYDFTTTDALRHRMWIVEKNEDIDALEHYFENIDSLYIADGHHRCASSALLAKEHEHMKAESDPLNYFMSFIIPESQLDILDFNRLIKDTNGLSNEDLLAQIGKKFDIETISTSNYKPGSQQKIGMYLNNQWHELTPKKETFDSNHPIGSLDSEILFQNILKDILNIDDLKTTKRVDFIGGHKGVDYLKEQVDKNRAKVAFALFPVSVERLKEIADKDLIMPPKTTWIEPKMRCGLTIYKL